MTNAVDKSCFFFFVLFLFWRENKAWHLMLIACWVGISHEISSFIFSEKKKKKKKEKEKMYSTILLDAAVHFSMKF